MQQVKINIGCGSDILEGWINCDLMPGPGVDKVFDLTDGIPMPDNSADYILASHVLEHIHLWHLKPMSEIHRVLKPGGIAEIRVPYGHNAEPYHLRFFFPGSMDYFCGDNMSVIALDSRRKQMFEKVDMRIKRTFWFGWHLKRYMGIKSVHGKTYSFPIGRKTEIIWKLRKV